MEVDIVAYQFHKELHQAFRTQSEFLETALGFIVEKLNLDQIYFFYWDPDSYVLSCIAICKRGKLLELDEEISVKPGSGLYNALQSEEGIALSTNLNYPAMYIPLKWTGYENKAHSGTHNEVTHLGALRFERLDKMNTFSSWDKELAKTLTEELGHNLSMAEINNFTSRQLERAKILTELTAIFASSIRREDSMPHIIQGIQRYFGFDRVRLYLVNEAENILQGRLSADIRGALNNLSHDKIPLTDTRHRFANILLTCSESVCDKNRDAIAYLPLKVQGKNVGLLVVDNLLSGQAVLKEDLTSLTSFAGQIALAIDNAMLFDRVQELSQYDELTKLPLRRFFNERFQEEMYRAERFSQPTALLWLDIDDFKDINDTYGHQIGDRVLKEISRVIFANLRKIDFPCRFGGDEIIILLPQSKPSEAKAMALRLAEEVKEIKIPSNISSTGEITTSVSIGVATFPENAGTAEELLKCADAALYWVKNTDKGNVALYSEIQFEDEFSLFNMPPLT